MANADRKHGQGTAATVATTAELGVPAGAGSNQRRAVEVELVCAVGTAPVYFTVDGSTPTVRGDNTFVCQAGGSARVPASGALPLTVKMISAAAFDYGLEVFAQ